jgi:quinol monooxygenase YgiN
MVIVTGSVTARPDAIAEVEELCLAHVRRSRTEPGCLLHSVQRDVENNSRFVFLEYWRSRADLDRHFAVPESSGLIQSLRDLCVDLSPIEIYDVIAPKPLENP